MVRRQDPVGGRPVPRDRTVRVVLTFRRVPVVDTAATVAVRPNVVLSEARTKLESGDFAGSHRLYARTLKLAETRRDSANALFGQSFARQQMIQTDSVPADTARRLVRTYREARQLDSAKYFAAAQYNIGLVLSAAGRHGDAARELALGARAGGPLRGGLLVSAGREWLRAERPAQAVPVLREAARDSTVAAEAQTLLLDAYRRSRDTSAILALADTLRGASAPLAAVNEALVEMMADSAWAGGSQCERCLLLVARNAALLNLGPEYFESSERPGSNGSPRRFAGRSWKPPPRR